MNHAEVHAELGDYLEGDLPLERRALVDAHLDGCPGCAGRLAELRATVDALRTLGDVEPPPGFADRVMARIAAGEGRPSAFTRLLQRTPPVLRGRLAPPLLALASAAIVLVWLRVPAELQSPDVAVPRPSAESLEKAIRDGGLAGAPAVMDEDEEKPVGPKVSAAALDDALRSPGTWLQQMLALDPEARRKALLLLAQPAGDHERLRRLALEVRALPDPAATEMAAELEKLSPAP